MVAENKRWLDFMMTYYAFILSKTFIEPCNTPVCLVCNRAVNRLSLSLAIMYSHGRNRH